MTLLLLWALLVVAPPANAIQRADIATRLCAMQADPCAYLHQVLGVPEAYIWHKPRQIAQALVDHQFVAVPAGHSVSKTWLAGRLVCWFKSCFRPSTVITTAPSDNQVRNQLWREIASAYQGARIPLGGNLTALQWDMKLPDSALAELHPEEREMFAKDFAIGFSTSPDTSQDHATKMQGWHNKYVLVIIDEAAGILAQIWRTVMEALVVNERVKVLAIGNPTDPDCEFADACRREGKLEHDGQPYMSDQGWAVIPIAVMDTPNYRQGREVIPGLAGRDYEERIAKKYGRNTDGYNVRVAARFPSYREGTYYGQELAQAVRDGRVGAYPWDPAARVFTFSDFGDMYTATIFAQFLRGRIRVIDDYWDNEGLGAPAWSRVLDAKPYTYGGHFAGPDFDSSNRKSFQTGQATKDVLAGLGKHVQAVITHRFDEGIQAVRVIWPLTEINVPQAETFRLAAAGYGKAKNLRLSTDDEPAYHNQPQQTWHRHMMDGFRHLAMAFRYMAIGGQYIGDSRMVAQYHHAKKGPSPYAKWKRFNRG